MTSLPAPSKIIPAVLAAALLALAGCSEEVSKPLTDEELAAVREQLAPVARVAVAEGAAAAPADVPAEPTPAAAAPAAPESAPAAPAAPAAESAAAAETPAATAEAAPAPAAVAAAGDALDLATRSGCMACHKVDVKLVGPAYQEVAARYRGDVAALETLVAKVKSGGMGVWGEIPMPPNAHISDEDIRTVVAWVLSL
jgi:cytochrome c